MRTAFAAALLAAALAAAPAHATQGLLCRPVSGTGPSLSLVLGAGGGVAGAHLTQARDPHSSSASWSAVTVRQSWIDEQRVWVDLTDEPHMSDEGRLRATFVRRGRFWHVAGTFVRAGRVYRVRCEEN